MTRAYREDLTGQRFGRLVVTGEVHGHGQSHRVWACRCDCGADTKVAHGSLKRGAIRSCGCLRREKSTERMTKHGHARRGAVSRAYGVWCGMVARCVIPSATGYEQYGGRGVRVCERWREFEHFLADMGEPAPGQSIDRIDGAGHYEPGNEKSEPTSAALSREVGSTDVL